MLDIFTELLLIVGTRYFNFVSFSILYCVFFCTAYAKAFAEVR